MAIHNRENLHAMNRDTPADIYTRIRSRPVPHVRFALLSWFWGNWYAITFFVMNGLRPRTRLHNPRLSVDFKKSDLHRLEVRFKVIRVTDLFLLAELDPK